MGTFHNILRKLPIKPVFLLHDFEDISIRSEPEEKSNSFTRTKGSGKERTIYYSTDIVNWALLEAIEETKEEYKNH
jgi:hypothetical protein